MRFGFSKGYYTNPYVDKITNETMSYASSSFSLLLPFLSLLRFPHERSLTPSSSSPSLPATQFQPTSARRAYPCWDEPALKATFNLTMFSERDTVNLSNMDVNREHNVTRTEYLEDGTKLETEMIETVFHQTPLVSFSRLRSRTRLVRRVLTD